MDISADRSGSAAAAQSALKGLTVSLVVGTIVGMVAVAGSAVAYDVVVDPNATEFQSVADDPPIWLIAIGIAIGVSVSAFLVAGNWTEAKGKVSHRAMIADVLADTELHARAAADLMAAHGDVPEVVVPGILGDYTLTAPRPGIVVAGAHSFGWAAIDPTQVGDVSTIESARYDDPRWASPRARPVRDGRGLVGLRVHIETRVQLRLSDDRMGLQATAAADDAYRSAFNTFSERFHATWSADIPLYPETIAANDPPQPRLVRDHHDAEELAADWIRYLGWPNAKRTRASGDGGLDVFGDGLDGCVAAQVKFEANKAGRPVLQALWGAATGAGADTAIFVSSAGYTATAHEWADHVGMALFQFSLDGGLEASNSIARTLLTAAKI